MITINGSGLDISAALAGPLGWVLLVAILLVVLPSELPEERILELLRKPNARSMEPAGPVASRWASGLLAQRWLVRRALYEEE